MLLAMIEKYKQFNDATMADQIRLACRDRQQFPSDRLYQEIAQALWCACQETGRVELWQETVTEWRAKYGRKR